MTDPKTTGEAGAGSGGVSPVVTASVIGGMLVAAAIGFVTLRGGPGEETEAGAPAESVAESVRASPEPVIEAPQGVDAAAAETESESEIEAEIEAGAPEVLRFDLVRVDPTGGAVIAGLAAPGAEVTLTLDGAPVETVAADATGQFAAIIVLPPSEQPQILGLRAVLPDGVDLNSAETVIIAPLAGGEVSVAIPPDPPPATRADAPGVGEATSVAPVLGGGDAPPASGAASDLAALAADSGPNAETTVPAVPVAPAAPDATEAPAPTETAATVTAQTAPEAPAPVAEAPAVLLADGDGVRVLQGPGGAPEAMTELRLDAITYDVAGDVTLAGRAPAEGSVRVALNNQPINLGEVGPGGQWSLDLPDVDPGTYTLVLEQVAADGRVTGRIETPFLREDPDRIQRNPMLVDPGASVITVQSGFTLWGIAEANFGDGIRYVQIFEENRDRIRDPDLIFPGQIFALPDLPRAVE